MIIKMTCEDNDFSDYIVSFLRHLFINLTLDMEAQIDQYKVWIDNPNVYLDSQLAYFQTIEDSKERLQAIKNSKSIEDIKEARRDLAIKRFETKDRINQILNPNYSYKLVNNDKEFLVERVTKSFEAWLNANLTEEEYYAPKQKRIDYIMKNLKITILSKFEDRWENGESVYWFQHSGVVANQ